ncbi:hypothetical protein G4177_03090 [Corallococcus sp. ZKHCc1 1396]|uniref:YgiT-type zinc finger protein n=1 Tax=Corallococcus soli TaxID=2710757 RepID=A0ABR9PGZ1_9BACT|nr:hypothetical protein [Corallococcus soli]MBE4747160.1 hypothetical protein [Corallococcus soli]
MKTFKCPCNKGEVREVARPGRRTHFRNIPDLEIPADVSIPTCSACGEEWIDEEVAARLDDAMEEVYRAVVAAKVEGAIRDLKPFIAQRDLEQLLDLSGGYISKVKSGKETSASLVSVLMLLAEAPRQRIDALRNLWMAEPKEEAERASLPDESQWTVSAGMEMVVHSTRAAERTPSLPRKGRQGGAVIRIAQQYGAEPSVAA